MLPSSSELSDMFHALGIGVDHDWDLALAVALELDFHTFFPDSLVCRDIVHTCEERTVIRMGPSGPDAKSIRDLFLRRAIVASISGPQVKKDLSLLIDLYLDYGNNDDTNFTKNNKYKHVGAKLHCYSIRRPWRRKTGKNLRDELTLSRIALAFPLHTAQAIIVGKIPGVLRFSTFFKQELPLLMQHTVLPSLIPAKQFTKDLREIALVLNIEKSVRLAGKARYIAIWTIMETVEEMIESSVKYIDAAINNDIDDEHKLMVLRQAGVLDVDADGKLVLAPTTLALINKLPGIKADLYSLKYSDAVEKMRDDVDEDQKPNSD